MMHLVDNWVGTEPPFQSPSSLLSCSVELRRLKLHPMDILAIGTPYVIEDQPSEVIMLDAEGGCE